jgi:hypothetical protein
VTWLANNCEGGAIAVLPPPAPSLTAAVAELEEACRRAGVVPKALGVTGSAVTASIDEPPTAGERVLYALGVQVWRVRSTPCATSVAGVLRDRRVIVYTAREDRG